MDKSPSKDSDDGSCSGIFTLDEVNRLKIIQDVVDRRLTTPMAAQRLGISDRQCRRLLLRYHESGPPGMANAGYCKVAVPLRAENLKLWQHKKSSYWRVNAILQG